MEQVPVRELACDVPGCTVCPHTKTVTPDEVAAANALTSFCIVLPRPVNTIKTPIRRRRQQLQHHNAVWAELARRVLGTP